jgi:hypothetical protein
MAVDQQCARELLSASPESALLAGQALDRQICALVRLGALLAIGAPTVTLRWAVELASGAGATDEALVGVLVFTAAVVGAAEIVSGAPRLGLALGLDFDLDALDTS